MNKISVAISVAALLMYGCSDKPKEQEQSSATQKSQSATTPSSGTIYGANAQQTEATAPSEGDVQLNTKHVANVLETMNGGGYTYAKVDEDGNIYWIAGPQVNIAVGTRISFLEQMVMSDFTSKALNKQFDQLVFVSAIVPADGSASTAPEQTLTLDDAHANCDHSKEATPTQIQQDAPTVVSVAKNADGYTIEELYAKKDTLKDKNIKLNAKVVKVSKNIMGKDWIHLQDGSGAAGTNDIIATAVNSTIQVGDTVTTEGIIKTDIDLGYGYNFSVLIEEAKFTSL
ncbi:MAG: hypothetical protein RQ763_00610 [Sulfurimonas sp.]|uniref:hypothetical protein n=1 Tax=Sulfurimonas sp. TaxID=2022749 RepID=UPI0028CD2A40|nr:hypothetical protein [Sulfurimonas sp.]MDT8337676.1 hypothetical protein [Sulfurimonas sp.]